jgi:hypothetical protein
MLGIVSTIALFSITIFSIFLKTIDPYREGWFRKLTKFGWVFIGLSVLTFTYSFVTSVSNYVNGLYRSEAAKAEITYACYDFLEGIRRLDMQSMVDYAVAIDQARTYDGELASELEEIYSKYEVGSKALTMFTWTGINDHLDSLLTNGLPPVILSVNLQFRARGLLSSQELLELKYNQFQRRLEDIMSRYQSTLSANQISVVMNLRYHMVLRDLDYESVGFTKQQKKTLGDYYITLGQLNDLVRKVVNAARGVFSN